MKSTRFLKKIKKKEKLELVEPSEEMKESYIIKSESNLESAKILLENDKLEESIGLAYYGMYHLIVALLFKIGIKSENHTTSIILLKDLFGIDNKYVKFAKKERIDKQYYVDFRITKEEVKEMIIEVEEFNKILFDFIEKVSLSDIEKYREKLNSILSEK